MGGELEKEVLINNKGKSSNHKNKHLKNKNDNEEKAHESKSVIKTLKNDNQELKRGISKKKKDKIQIYSKDKVESQEKKVLELIHEKNAEKEDYDKIYDIISKHFLLQTLNDQAKNEIIISMSLYSLKEGTLLYKQGAEGNFWYIVQYGQLNRFMDNKLIGTINEGESFGEHALMNNSPRGNTVKSVTSCKLWVLKRQVFRKILEFIFTTNYEQNI